VEKVEKPTNKYYKGIRIRSDIYEYLVTVQSVLQLRDKKRYSLSDVLEYLINLLPEIEVVVQPPAVVKKVGVKEEDKKT
jgi:predicted CopG family antitoxin